jgi:hypothetical protein
VDFLWTLYLYLVCKCFDGFTSTLEVGVLKQHLLQLGIGRTDITEFIVPLVDDSVRQPLSLARSRDVLSRLILGRLVVEWDGVVPLSVSE